MHACIFQGECSKCCLRRFLSAHWGHCVVTNNNIVKLSELSFDKMIVHKENKIKYINHK